jgi:hypothetical protein
MNAFFFGRQADAYNKGRAAFCSPHFVALTIAVLPRAGILVLNDKMATTDEIVDIDAMDTIKEDHIDIADASAHIDRDHGSA